MLASRVWKSSAKVAPSDRPRIEVRKPAFEIPEDAPKYFFRGEKGVTALFYALSAVFPDGERMFIDAVGQFRDRIPDGQLRRAIATFAGQEAQHGRIHEAYNAYAAERGFRVGPVSAAVARRTAFMKARLPPVVRLAATAALEHFTALMAEQVLGDAAHFDGVDEAHAKLWRWHAAEESEHKAVAFDVLEAVSGSYFVRIRSYAVTSVMFPTLTMLHTYYLMWHDGSFTDLRAHLGLARFLIVEPGLIPRLLPGWLDYLRPDFHPWDRDDRALLDRWRAEWASAGLAT